MLISFLSTSYIYRDHQSETVMSLVSSEIGNHERTAGPVSNLSSVCKKRSILLTTMIFLSVSAEVSMQVNRKYYFSCLTDK